MVTSEIYLTKEDTTKDEWHELIKTISTYNGILNKWQIFIKIENNQIRYIINTKCNLPITLNNLDFFLLKEITFSNLPISTIVYPIIFPIGSNTIDILEFCKVKNKGILECIEINIKKVYEDKILTKIYLYLRKNNQLKKYRVLLNLPTSILAINFKTNKRFFYRKAPKYLDVSKSLHLLNNDPTASILKVDTFPYLQGNFYLRQNSYNFDKHSIIIGSSGSGKSKFISLLLSNINKNIDTKTKYKIVVIDPHTSLENDIGGLGKVIDFKSTIDSINLFINKSSDVVSSTELLLGLFKSLIAEQYNSKLERVLRHAIYVLLVAETFNFNTLRELILNLEYRNELLRKITPKLPTSIITFFLADFNDLKTKSYSEAISPIIAFIDEMEIIPIFNQKNDLPNLEKTINENFLTLFSLDRTKLGDKVIKTISGLIMQQLLILIQRYTFLEHIIFIVDEVSVVENPILARFLSEARKYNLSLILAGQYFNQISVSLKDAIFANVINYYIFRVSRLDANILVDNFNMKIPLDNTKEQKIKLLTELNNRECLVRIDSNGILLPAIKGSTLDFKSIPRKRNNDSNNTNLKELPIIKKKNNFSINSNISLKDILIKNSSSRKEIN